jgi:hypothetical protein
MKKQLTLAIIAVIMGGSAHAQDAAKPSKSDKAISPKASTTAIPVQAAKPMQANAPQKATGPAKATSAPQTPKTVKPAETPAPKNN